MLSVRSANVYRSGIHCSIRDGAQRRISTTAPRLKNGPFDILFCGTEQFSLRCLKQLVAAEDVWKSIHVLTPPPSRTGRGGKAVSIPEVHSYALEQGFDANTVPVGIKGKSKGWLPPDPFATLRSDQVLVTASFGSILPQSFLSAFEPHKRLNVHPSLLPKYRGASPINWAIANGETETGVCIQQLARKLDSGDVVAERAGIPIAPDATAPQMLEVLAEAGAELLVQALRDLRDGKQVARPQDGSQVTFAPLITRDTQRVNFSSQSARILEQRHRGMGDREPLWTMLQGKEVQLGDAVIASASEDLGERYPDVLVQPGVGVLVKSHPTPTLLIACAADEANPQAVTWLAVGRVKPAGRQWMGVKDWWNGMPDATRRRQWVEFDAV